MVTPKKIKYDDNSFLNIPRYQLSLVIMIIVLSSIVLSCGYRRDNKQWI